MKMASKRGRASLIQKGATTAAKLVKVTPERQIVEHLQAAVAGVHSLPLLTGKLGCEALDCLELIDKFRTGYRDRVKLLLLKDPYASLAGISRRFRSERSHAIRHGFSTLSQPQKMGSHLSSFWKPALRTSPRFASFSASATRICRRMSSNMC